MNEFITRLDSTGDGPRVAVKDLIDVEGVPTTAGSKAVADRAEPAEKDAPCLAGLRAADARIVGKANLHELAMLPIGTNPWFGSPVNPLDAAVIPGGSSSGSAVAVAVDEADVALGSDTGGSVRIPSACCGTTGLKTTHGRVSLDGVWPLAPSFDTIGPMATDVAGLVLGMELLEPGFSPAPAAATRIGRLRTAGDPAIEAAVDAALREAEFEVVELDWDGLETGFPHFGAIYFTEIWDSDHELFEHHPEELGDDVKALMGLREAFTSGLADTTAALAGWRQSFDDLFEQVQLLALPTVPIFPPTLEALTDPDAFVGIITDIAAHVTPFNVTGAPATAQPVPVDGSHLPTSIQLVGPRGGEELLLATAQRLEDAFG